VTIDAELLKEQLPHQRWFGARHRDIRSVNILDHTVVDDGPPSLVFAILEVLFADDGRALYHCPLLVEGDGRPRDAFEDVSRLAGVGDLMAHGHTSKGNNGTFHFGGPGLDPLAPPGSWIRGVEAEQSNSSVVLDDAVIVKFFRRVEPGINPDLELNRLLTNEGFPHIPPQVGEIIYEGEFEGEEISIDLGIAQQFIANASEGWTEVLGHVNDMYNKIHSEDAREDMAELVRDRTSEILERIEQLGDDTASLHVLLSREEVESDFVPEPVTPWDMTVWGNSVLDSIRDLAEKEDTGVRDLRLTLEDRVEAVTQLDGDLGNKIRIHGDYHLGQVLLSKREWLIIDFEGEPARSLEIRRMKQPALRDAAGMIRSFSYAALVPLLERGSDDWEGLREWADEWIAAAREAFLTGYLRTSHEGRFLPADRDVVAMMLDFFELEKAIYELGYERGHRPHWMSIPLQGIKSLIERGDHR
jgi:trehalose synthase-fused probable maltokinase